MHPERLLLLALLAAAPALAADNTGAAPAQKIYKWTDADGKVHYDATPPPTDRAAQKLTTHGVKQGETERTATPEERALAEEKAAQAKDAKAREAEQKRRDVALLQTYTSVKDIDASRDRNLALPQQALVGLGVRAKRAEERMAQLQKEQDNFVRGKKPVPAPLRDEINDQRNVLSGIADERKRFEDQIAKIKAKADADRQRYIELTGNPR